ncbi:MAG: Crp/Fnr family transcriptional regulator [Burkholderiaceae bacterium]
MGRKEVEHDPADPAVIAGDVARNREALQGLESRLARLETDSAGRALGLSAGRSEIPEMAGPAKRQDLPAPAESSDGAGPVSVGQEADWSAFPWVQGVRPAPAELGPGAAVMSVPAGAVLFDELQPCAGFPLVFDGEVQVTRRSADGRSLELYRVSAGEICLVSAASLFADQPMGARGQTTRATRLALVPPAVFQAWMAEPAFRGYVLSLFAERMADLTATVDALAFHRLDERLAAALLGHGSELHCTHQQLAEQLGTVREMITRVLRRFERAGWIALGRERIRIVDPGALRARAAGDASGHGAR